jgi:hypothetical protein
MRAVPNVAAVLADHGVEPGPDGYATADLARLAENRGWRAGAEAVPNARGYGRYRAFVWQPADPLRHSAVSFASRGRGPTEEQALASALALALARTNGKETQESKPVRDR